MTFKRLLDICVALAGITVLTPVFIIIAIRILLDSPGPIIYRGKRTGLNGKHFEIYKFRTMYSNSEKIGGDTTAFNDPRITKTGVMLRRYKLDELPQLFNVLKGEMSLVGPRPELQYYTDRYTAEEKQVLTVKPGITDLSSLNFSSLDKSVGAQNADAVFEEKILPGKNRLRLQYVKERSLWLDIKIIFKTMLAVTRKLSGHY